MILTVAESRKYLEGYYDLVIDDSQFQILDESVCIWFCQLPKRFAVSYQKVCHMGKLACRAIRVTKTINFMQDS